MQLANLWGLKGFRNIATAHQDSYMRWLKLIQSIFKMSQKPWVKGFNEFEVASERQHKIYASAPVQRTMKINLRGGLSQGAPLAPWKSYRQTWPSFKLSSSLKMKSKLFEVIELWVVFSWANQRDRSNHPKMLSWEPNCKSCNILTRKCF